MNLNLLRFATAVASTGSFTAAAQQCCVTQPTLSNGIAQLEAELGEKLFVRTTRTVAITPFGDHMLSYMQEVLRAQTALIKQGQAFTKPKHRIIRIGMSPLINTKLLGAVLEPFAERNQSVDIIFREMNMADLDRLLHAGMLDFIFGVVSVHKGKVDAAFLYEEALRFVPRKGAQAKEAVHAVHLKDIADETYVMVPDACGLSRATRALFRRNRRKLHEYSGEALSYQVLEEWAALGIGSAILPLSKITAHPDESRPISDKSSQEVTIQFEAVWKRDGVQATHLKAFAKHLLGAVPELARGQETTI